MSALVTEHLPLLTGAPNGIRKLRELILELAMRGRLVPQDEDDEPTSELLKRIFKEERVLLDEGIIRKKRSVEDISDKEKPFALPDGWRWVRVAAIGHDWGQKIPVEEFTYIDVGSVDNIAGRIRDPQVLDAIAAPSRARKIVKPGTVIYSTIRPYLLNIAVIDEEYSPEPIASTAFAIVHPFCKMPAKYLLHCFRSPMFVKYVESVQMGIAYPAINDSQFFSGLIPLPPLAEQHRIVARVDELMALCDQLEAREADAESAHAQLVEALLGSLTHARDANELAISWQRLSQHFHTVFTTESSIDALKQTTLQLAVTGRLTLKYSGFGTHSAENNELPPLPVEWNYVPFNDLIDQEQPIAYGVLVPGPETSGGVPFVRIADLSVENPAEFPAKTISTEVDSQFSRTRLRGGEILMGVVGSIGKLGIAPESWAGANIARAVCRIVPNPRVSRNYVLYLLQSDLMRKQFLGDTRTLAQPTLNIGLIRTAQTPLPPLDAQNRIVAKVDQLMALCDQLKSRLIQARQLNQQLASTLVEQAVA